MFSLTHLELGTLVCLKKAPCLLDAYETLYAEEYSIDSHWQRSNS